MNLIKNAVNEGRSTLTEVESKQVMAKYGVPVVREKMVTSPSEAVLAAQEIGFPVVLKAVGASLSHKTERGLVHVGLASPEMVTESANEISSLAKEEMDGFVVQPQIKGTREFMAGIFTDPQFGPVVMFGIGGVFTEAFEDVSLRLAPVSEADILDMIDEINAKPLLGSFRGEKAVDQQSIIKILKGLSDLAGEFPQIAEVDINPLVATPAGELVAVDALVVLKEKDEPIDYPMPISPKDVGAFFRPRSVAFVGASAGVRKWGHMLSTNVIAGGYEGDIYLVNPKGGTIFQRTAFKNVTEIPGEVDLAVVTIPAVHVIDLFPQFEEKGIRYVLLITSGFGETGIEGKKLEKELVEKAKLHNIVLLGPNTMGICNPHLSFHCIGSHTRPEAGSTALVSQSGNMGTQLLGFALRQGLGIRVFCGSGNEAMITIEDCLEVFETDEATHTLILYIESVKNGRRFYESAKRLGKKKPVVLLKGGRTSVGGKAAASHTGAMASDMRVFDSACRQAGIVSVERPMDLLDLSAAFSSLPLPPGNRVAIMTLGGGWGVVTADLCAKYGLAVPELSHELISSLDKILPPYWSRANPIDIVGERDLSIPGRIAEELMNWDGCDAVIILGTIGRRHPAGRVIESAKIADPDVDKKWLASAFEILTDFENKYVQQMVELMETCNKPIVGVPIEMSGDDKPIVHVEGSKYAGIFFETPERAVNVLARMYTYHRFLLKD